ncbi:MAG: hypothetical protein QXR65_04300 [Candidatus Bathyarchaeia archaeon]
MTADSRVRRYVEAAIRGAEWLANRQLKDGSIRPELGLGPMYKAVAALAYAGKVVEANRLLNWLRDKALIRPGEFKLTFNPESSDGAGTAFYPNAWIMLGSLKLMRFDVASVEAMDGLSRYQVGCGGFMSTLEGGRVDILNTAMGGWISLYYGRIAQAERAGQLLRRMAELQPEPGKLYYVYDCWSDDLLRAIPENRWMTHVVDTSKPEQHFYHSGIAMVLLSDLYKATGKTGYLEAAEEVYFKISSSSKAESFRWPSKCKDGWGAALLYQATGRSEHRLLAEKVADKTFLETQGRDGGWKGFHAPLTDDYSEKVEVSAEELTAEFVFELLEIAKCLA